MLRLRKQESGLSRNVFKNPYKQRMITFVSKLSPVVPKNAPSNYLPTDLDNSVKAIFGFPHQTPWRVIMLGDAPGRLSRIRNRYEPE
jgi:hypothetical protein